VLRGPAPLVEAVGVVVNWSPVAVGGLSRAVGLHAVQLHGDEPPGVVRELAETHRVIKAFRVRRGFRPDALRRYRHAAAFLLDGFHLPLWGGPARPFDWRFAQRGRRYGGIV